MKKLLIIKTGGTFPSIRKNHGDFEDCIINNAGVHREEVVVTPVYEDKKMPEIEDVYGIIITGSHSMVSHREDWSEMLAIWLRENEHRGIPTLGICYGHQLIAHAFGGVVDYHPDGKEFGTVEIELTEEGRRDPLLGILPEKFLGHVAHSQSVIELPKGARVLAKNSFEPHHAFALGDCIWGVQFHPEFSSGVAGAYIDELEEPLMRAGYDIKKLSESVREHSYGMTLLKRFVEIASDR